MVRELVEDVALAHRFADPHARQPTQELARARIDPERREAARIAAVAKRPEAKSDLVDRCSANGNETLARPVAVVGARTQIDRLTQARSEWTSYERRTDRTCEHAQCGHRRRRAGRVERAKKFEDGSGAE